MRQVSSELAALLESNQFLMADLYTIETRLGVFYRYTNYDFALFADNEFYKACGVDAPIISRTEVSNKLGIELDSMSVTIQVNQDVMLGSIGFIQSLHNGYLDGAKFTLHRAFLDANNPTTTVGVMKMFDGWLVDPTFDRNAVEFSVTSYLDVLDVQMPRDLYQAGCKNTLFDGQCALSREAYAVAGTVEVGTTLARIFCNISQPQGYFSQGVLEFTSGDNAGVKRTVRLHESGSILLTLPLLDLPEIGDQFKLYPGCDKRLDTCINRFNNFDHFRGEPFIPVPETAV